MRAVIKVSPDTELVELRDIETPALPPSGHARVTVVAAGICGTDLHIIDGSYSSRPPVALGHEVSGIVAEVSADVDPAWIGKPVAMETFFSTCGVCQFCRAGQPNMCAERVSIGSGTNGGFAETIIVMTTNLGTDADDRTPENTFPRELLGRLDVNVAFEQLSPETVQQIAAKEVEAAVSRIARQGWQVEVADDVADWLTKRQRDTRLGARGLHREIERLLLAPLVAFNEHSVRVRIRADGAALTFEPMHSAAEQPDH